MTNLQQDRRKVPRFKDISGNVYDRLTVLKFVGKNKHGHTLWMCKCICGKQVPNVPKGSLSTGNTRSCGCLERELTANRNFSHGKAKTPLYRVYHGITTRCLNTKTPNYKNYGGRGIECLWKSFEEFERDMGEEYYKLYKGPKTISIHRVDNDGNYSKENCRWTDYVEQANNTRRNHYVTFQGETMTLTQWARKIGSTQERIRARLKLGFSTEQALTYKKHEVRI